MKPEAPVTHTVLPAISYFQNRLSCLPDCSTTKKIKSVAPIENLCAINKQSLLQKNLCNTNKQICAPKKTLFNYKSYILQKSVQLRIVYGPMICALHTKKNLQKKQSVLLESAH
jgi:hypothetical protein